MSTPTELSPNVDNIQVGKGVVEFKIEGSDDYRHLGNCTAFTLTPEVETLEHFSSMLGTKKRDLLIVIEQKMTVAVTMEEMTAQNIALMVYGTVDLAAVGGPEIEIFGTSSIRGALRFTGTNDVGPKILINLHNVSWQPSGDLEQISDEFNAMELEGAVLAATSGENINKFGTIKVTNSTPS